MTKAFISDSEFSAQVIGDGSASVHHYEIVKNNYQYGQFYPAKFTLVTPLLNVLGMISNESWIAFDQHEETVYVSEAFGRSAGLMQSDLYTLYNLSIVEKIWVERYIGGANAVKCIRDVIKTKLPISFKGCVKGKDVHVSCVALPYFSDNGYFLGVAVRGAINGDTKRDKELVESFRRIYARR